jgi:hypothetical protein
MNEALLTRVLGTKTQRTIYVRGMDPADAATLTDRGYTVIDLDNVDDRAEWCLGVTQAALDGTVSLNKQQVEALELEMRSRGLLDTRRMQFNVNIKAGQTTKELLSWSDSRHTLQGNTLLMDPKRIAEHTAETHRKASHGKLRKNSGRR